MKVSHVMLGVSDLERSIAFYRDKVGLPVQFQIPGFAFLDAGTLIVALNDELWKNLGQAPGASQLVFGVDDVKAVYAALKAKGVEFMNEPRNVNGREWAANFRDPDGHLLSIFGPPGIG